MSKDNFRRKSMNLSSKISTLLPMKTSFLILLFLVCSFSGSYGTKKAVNLINPHFKPQARKLGGVYFLDYQEAVPNPSHDPRKGKGGPKVANMNP